MTEGEAAEGARTPSNSRPMPPCRSRSISSIESAPATIPATSAGTFNRAFGDGTLSFSATSPDSPHDSASTITGSSPAHDTKFGSSKPADTAERA